MNIKMKIIIIIVLIYLSLSYVSCLNCGQFDSHMGATFDLTDLIRSTDQPMYAVEDGDIPCTTYVEQNFTYVFNVCGTVAGGLPPQCLQQLNAQDVSMAGAVQVNKRATISTTDDWCYIVGKFSDSGTDLKLIDEEDPSKGLKMTYYGDYCNGPPRVQRQFNLVLGCEDKLNPVPLHAYEYEHCVYTVTIPSVYGCPLECPVAARKLCAGNGHCAYDSDKGGAHCFCNQGYFGPDCSQSSKTRTYSPVLLGLIVTLFIIIGLLVGGVILMIRQVSAYRDDMANYQVLKGDPDDQETAVV